MHAHYIEKTPLPTLGGLLSSSELPKRHARATERLIRIYSFVPEAKPVKQ